MTDCLFEPKLMWVPDPPIENDTYYVYGGYNLYGICTSGCVNHDFKLQVYHGGIAQTSVEKVRRAGPSGIFGDVLFYRATAPSESGARPIKAELTIVCQSCGISGVLTERKNPI